MTFKYRLATNADIEGILQLQSKYLFANISPAERLQGFVTTPFTISQIEAALREKGVFIAENDDKIVGYAFAASWDFFSQWDIFPYMISRFPEINFHQETLTDKNTFQYGPVCIDMPYRGLGVFQRLFETMRLHLQKHYPIGITFINQVNEVSYKAHTKRLGLEVIDRFVYKEKSYYGLAFYTHQSVL